MVLKLCVRCRTMKKIRGKMIICKRCEIELNEERENKKRKK